MIYHSYADLPCTAADAGQDVLREGWAVHAPSMLRTQPGRNDQCLYHLKKNKITLKRRCVINKNENGLFI